MRKVLRYNFIYWVKDMKLIDNVNERLKDDLENEIKTNSKVEIAAASFSKYAFKELKEQ